MEKVIVKIIEPQSFFANWLHLNPKIFKEKEFENKPDANKFIDNCIDSFKLRNCAFNIVNKKV